MKNRPDNTTLYVGNLDFTTTDDDLRALFGADGRLVRDVNIICDFRSGRSRGFAFVEMGTDDDASAAIGSLDGTELTGRKIRVNGARERLRRPRGRRR